ncbi:MAG: hypothetical protein HQL66_10075 [Magnetococcales bacterium]|nr:hypothetical protein [Magnetococcales bacterium]
MDPQYAPDITEEQMAAVQRFHKMADEICKNPSAGYFKKEDLTGVRIYSPDEPRPESPYERLRRTGEIPY